MNTSFCKLKIILSVVCILILIDSITLSWQSQTKPIAFAQREEIPWTGEILIDDSVPPGIDNHQTGMEGHHKYKFTFNVLNDNSIEGEGTGETNGGAFWPGGYNKMEQNDTFSVNGRYTPETGKVEFTFSDDSPSSVKYTCSYDCSDLRSLVRYSLLKYWHHSDWPPIDLENGANFVKSTSAGTGTGTVKLTIFGSCMIDIYADAFLPPWTPKGRVPNPNPLHDIDNPFSDRIRPYDKMKFDYHEFSTDNRNTPIKGGSARQWSYVELDICAKQPLIKKTHGIGESHGFRYEWQNGKLVEVEDRKTASDSGMSERIIKNGHDVIVHIKGAASLPHVKPSPDIDYEYKITLHQDGNYVLYHIEGAHDGFPAYQIYIGSTLVHFHTPKVAEGQNPLSPFNKGQSITSLFPPMEFDVEKTGKISKEEAYAPLNR